jgi:hypothetical protein
MSAIQTIAAAGAGLLAQSGTFTGGSVGATNNAHGYDPNNTSLLGAIGSALSPATLTGGKTLYAAYQLITSTPSNDIILYISGFSADPGKGYFKTFNLTGLNAAKASSAASYGYSAGKAIWSWSGVGSTVTASGTKTYTFT